MTGAGAAAGLAVLTLQASPVQPARHWQVYAAVLKPWVQLPCTQVPQRDVAAAVGAGAGAVLMLQLGPLQPGRHEQV